MPGTLLQVKAKGVADQSGYVGNAGGLSLGELQLFPQFCAPTPPLFCLDRD